jgi:tetratricopeptide (TPR) repeat protein
VQGAAAQQVPDPQGEIAIIRASEALEARNDLAGAERLIRGILTRSPTSLTSLITLERLLTMQGRVSDLEPYIDRLLQVDPQSVIGHQMQVRLYATINKPADLTRAAEAWIGVSPNIETPYREIARAMRGRGDLEGAAAVLDRGRRKIGGNALALELGDIYSDLKDYDRAALEWSRGIGKDGQGFLLVQRRLQGLPDGGTGAIPRLVATLRLDPTTPERRRAAATIALDAGLVADADALARQVYRGLKSAERPAFLVDVARRADNTGAAALAYWAYGELVKIDTDSTRMLALRSRYAQLALAVGDTARAARVYLDLERAAAPGSPQRRQALAARIELAADRGDAVHATADLQQLRSEFPIAPELDEVASRVANAWLDNGNLEEAEAAVAGINGARAGAARGRIYLRRGEVEKARAEIIASAPHLQGAEATEALTLAALMSRMSHAGGELVGRALGIAGDNPESAVRLMLTASKELAPTERADILDYAAVVADRASLPALAEVVRREIVETYPQSSAAPAALLSLASALVARGASIDDARLLLEKVILEYPKSALVPQARRDLDRLLGRVPGG